MEQLTTTPFGQRPVSAVLLKHIEAAQADPVIPHINKWEIFRELCTARAVFAVSDRDLTVLNALLSFHQSDSLSHNDVLVVFPSNKSLSDRAHGMAESTLRRHLAALVNAGLILRHDSPNGKRYAVRGVEGGLSRVFGFDLRPLLIQAAKISDAANDVRTAQEELRRLREEATLLKRDAIKLMTYGLEDCPKRNWEEIQIRLLEIHKQMRRKIDAADLKTIVKHLRAVMSDIHYMLFETTNMSGSDTQNERHYQNSNIESHESELCLRNNKGGGVGDQLLPDDPVEHLVSKEVRLPLALILKACPDILPYASDEIRHWHQLVALAGFVRGMMGVSPDAWEEAQNAMGPGNAAIVMACILQRISDINSPGGYLRALSRKASEGAFSPGPMVMALLNTKPTTQAS